MFGILMIVVAAVVVYKAAEMGNRSGPLWATISVAVTLLWGMFLPFGFAAGLFGTLLIMLICNLINDPSQRR